MPIKEYVSKFVCERESLDVSARDGIRRNERSQIAARGHGNPPMRTARNSLTVAVVAVACLGTALMAAPAQAATNAPDDSASALVETAEQVVGLSDDASPDTLNVVSKGTTAVIEATAKTPAVPVTVAPDNAESTVFTTDALDDTSTRFTAIFDSADVNQASWDVGSGAELFDVGDGRVSVSDADGHFLAGIEAPWAVDAAGNQLKTHYTVDGSRLTQHVEFTDDTVFPVVADPTVAVYPGYYQITLNKEESITATSSVAGCAALFSKSPVPALKAAAIGCAVFAAYGTPQLANGKCLRIHVVGVPPAMATWWPTWPQC